MCNSVNLFNFTGSYVYTYVYMLWCILCCTTCLPASTILSIHINAWHKQVVCSVCFSKLHGVAIHKTPW